MTLAAGLELSVVLVCLWGFVAILFTGEFSLGLFAFCSLALLAGYYFRRRGWKPSPWWGNASALLVFIVALSIFATTFNLLSATVHLFLFLQVTKYLTRQSLAENRWCYVISLFNVVGASVITTTFVFAPVLITYVLLMMVSLRLFVLARQAEVSAELQKQALGEGRQARKWYALAHLPTREGAGLQKALQMRLSSGFVFTGVVLTAVTLTLAGALFGVIPRVATQNLLQAYGPRQQESNVSAFSENVEFGAFTEIQLDERVALFVQPQTEDRPDYVRMRGVALDAFDGKSWKRTGSSYVSSGPYTYEPIFTRRVYAKRYEFKVMQPQGTSNFLFADSFPQRITPWRNLNYGVDWLAQSLVLLDAPGRDFQYLVESDHEELSLRQDPTTLPTLERPQAKLIPDVPEPEPEAPDLSPAGRMQEFMRAAAETAMENAVWADDLAVDEVPGAPAGDPFAKAAHGRRRAMQRPQAAPPEPDDPDQVGEQRPPARQNQQMQGSGRSRALTVRRMLKNYLVRCTELPETLQNSRLKGLAQDWAGDAETTFSKAMAIEQRLKTTYGYSLTPRATGNYIESFLFDVREGHCEYFATSMAVLLRNLGIPARVVNGFVSSEWNALSGMFTVRNKDAHSWVEVWLGDDYGWMTFDPTPPSGVSRRGERSALLTALSRLSDALRMRWYRYVIDYSAADQEHVLETLTVWRMRLLEFLRQTNIRGITSKDAKTIEHQTLGDTVEWPLILGAGALAGGVAGWLIFRLVRRRRHRRLSPVAFYDRLLREVARQGFVMLPGETPQEFAARVVAERPEWADLQPLTDEYYAARFAQHSFTWQARPRRGGEWQGTQPELSAQMAERAAELAGRIRRWKGAQT